MGSSGWRGGMMPRSVGAGWSSGPLDRIATRSAGQATMTMIPRATRMMMSSATAGVRVARRLGAGRAVGGVGRAGRRRVVGAVAAQRLVDLVPIALCRLLGMPGRFRSVAPACGAHGRPLPGTEAASRLLPRLRRCRRFRSRRPGAQHAELVALGICEHDPALLALANLGPCRAERQQPLDLGVAVVG